MNGSIIALNITAEDVKLARINKEGNENIVRRLYHLGSGKEGNRTYINATEVIRNFIQEEMPKSLQTVLVISSQDLDYKDFSFPFASPKKVVKAIDFEISSEYPPNEYIVDHIKTLTREPGKNSFLAAIASKDSLARQIKEAEDASLKIIGITSDISTLGNYFREEDEALVMEMGEGQTLFALYINGVPVLARDIPIGIKAIRKGSETVNNGQLKPLIGEIKRTIHSFNAKTGLNLSRVYVSGNIVSQQEILEVLKNNLELDFIEKIPQGTGFKIKEQRDDLNIYASVLGATEWKKNGISFNFLKDEFLKSDPRAILRSYFRWSTAIIVSFLFAVTLSLWFNIKVLEKRKLFLTTNIRETFSEAFPKVRRIVDEARQAKNILDAGKRESVGSNPSSETSVLDVLEIISRTVPDETNFQIISLFWDRGKLELNGKTDSFKTVNGIKELLSGSQHFSEVNISKANIGSDGQNVEFNITIRLAG